MRSKAESSGKEKKSGRPRAYKSKIPSSKTRELSNSTVAYNNALKCLLEELLRLIFDQTNSQMDIKEES